jgi:hypothetical protein
MMTGFIYEEFYPNAEMDIKDAYEYFFRITMGKMRNIKGEGYDLLYIDTDNYQDVLGRRLEKKVVECRINTFLDSFDYFEIVSERINEISINKDETKASLRYEVEYRAGFNDCPEEVIFKGDGLFRLKPGKYVAWDVYHISMPGFEI